MAVVKTKPTSPGRRFVIKVVNPELHKGEPYWPLVESQNKKGGRNNAGRITTRHQGGGHKQHYRSDRLQARQRRHSGDGRAHRIRPEPHREHRVAEIPRRRASLHHRAARCQRRRSADVGFDGADSRRQRDAAAQRAPRQRRSLRRVESRQRRADRAQRGRLRATGCARRRVCDVAFAFGRNAPRVDRMSRDARRSRQQRTQPALVRQSRCASLARYSSDGTRRCDEPGRPPARWRRRQNVRRVVTRCRRGARRRRVTRRARTSAPTA